MQRFLLLFFVLFTIVTSHGQEPLVLQEADSRAEFVKYFSQPIPERHWEIKDTVEAWKRWDLVENFSFGKDRGSIPMIADLQSLHPYFRDKVLELIRICRSRGIELAIVETYRTATKQREYRSMGRNYTRVKAGFSNHQYGLAVDVVPMIGSVPQWNNIKLWQFERKKSKSHLQ